MIESLISIKMPDLSICSITERFDVTFKIVGCFPSPTGFGKGLIEFSAPPEVREEIIREFRQHGPCKASSASLSIASGKDTVVLEVTARKCKVCEALAKSGCFLVLPVSAKGGYMDWLLIASDHDSLLRLINNLEAQGATVIVRTRRPIEKLTEDVLTPRQRQILEYAFRAGYFDFPRRTSLTDVSEVIGISKSTLAQHIRSAQRRLFMKHFSSAFSAQT